jgi:oligopeptide/dipeptide ABC transporter ATP-binding protein
MPNSRVIEIESVSKTYEGSSKLHRRKNGIKALNGVSFSLKSNEIVSLVGESGSGKSTLLRCLTLLEEFDSGVIKFNSKSFSKMNKRDVSNLRSKLQLVFQNARASFNPALTIGVSVMENVRDEKSKSGKRAIAIEALSQVGLSQEFFSRFRWQMSGGELQRAAIARALCSKPEVLLLDEPTSALDVSIQGQILNLLLDLKKTSDLTFLIATHDLALAKAFSDRVVVFFRGQIIESGPTDQVFSAPLHPYTMGLLSSDQGLNTEAFFTVDDSNLEVSIPDSSCSLISKCKFAEGACNGHQQLLKIADDREVRCWKADQLGTNWMKGN